MQGLQNCEDNFVFIAQGRESDFFMSLADFPLLRDCELGLYSSQTVLMAWASSREYKKHLRFYYRSNSPTVLPIHNLLARYKRHPTQQPKLLTVR